MKKLALSLAISLLATFLLTSMFAMVPVKAQARTRGPVIDMVRLKVVKSPDAELIAMQTETTHYLPDLIRTGDIEKLDSDGFTVLSAPGFHMGHVGFNIRADQSYRTDTRGRNMAYVAAVLSDVNFRHAFLHSYDQDGILASIYKYIVTKSTSLVPPAQGGWMSPSVPQHPYSPGSPFTSPPGEESSCGILKAAGYTFVDGGTIGVVDGADYWTKAGFGGAPLPNLQMFTPTYETAPTSAEHGARIINGLRAIGLNNMEHMPSEFSPYIEKVYQNAEFDMFMIFWSLGRFPDHLYDMTHSSQDCHLFPWRYNAPGINDPNVDAWGETVKFGLDHAEKLAAAWALQNALYTATNAYAFAYLQMYSRVYFTAANPDMRGVVNSPGFGSDNTWSWLNWHWASGHERYDTATGKTLIVYSNGEEPERLNPTYASTVYAWNVMNPTLDGMIAINPYTHADIPWLATSWGVQRWALPAEVTALNTPPGGDIIGGAWQEVRPAFNNIHTITAHGDTNLNGLLSVGEQVTLQLGATSKVYTINNIKWDIKVEKRTDPYNELYLEGVNTPVPPAAPTWGAYTWHELYPTFSNNYATTAFTDTNGDGQISASDLIELNGVGYHVDSITVTLQVQSGTTIRYVDYVGTGMKVWFKIRAGVEWQDGTAYTAEDAKFNWLFLRDNQIPRYTSAWQNIVDVAVVASLKAVVYLDTTSQFLLYDLAGTAAILPPEVWSWLNGKPSTTILGYDPSTNTTKPIGAGPRFGTADGPKNQLYGTGPYIFQFYDPVGQYADVWANPNYFWTIAEIADMKTSMFYATGDTNNDGVIDIDDLTTMTLSYGYYSDEPEYNILADVNRDGVVDGKDVAMLSFFWAKQKEYP